MVWLHIHYFLVDLLLHTLQGQQLLLKGSQLSLVLPQFTNHHFNWPINSFNFKRAFWLSIHLDWHNILSPCTSLSSNVPSPPVVTADFQDKCYTLKNKQQKKQRPTTTTTLKQKSQSRKLKTRSSFFPGGVPLKSAKIQGWESKCQLKTSDADTYLQTYPTLFFADTIKKYFKQYNSLVSSFRRHSYWERVFWLSSPKTLGNL